MSPQQSTTSYSASFARWTQDSSASMLEWMSLRMRYRMVYYGRHATPEDHERHRSPGAAHRPRRGSGCLECAELGGLPNLDHDITLRSGACVRRLRISGGTRESTPRVVIYQFRRLGPHSARHRQLRRASGAGSRPHQLLFLFYISI